MSRELMFSVQKQISEELALFPSRIAQYLFLLNTLEKKSQDIETKTEDLKNEILKNSGDFENKNVQQCEKCATERNVKSCDCKESSLLSALNKLFEARRKVIKDKMFVNEKAIEWTKKAQQVLSPFQSSPNGDAVLGYLSTVNFPQDHRSSRKSVLSSEQSGVTNMALRHTEQRETLGSALMSLSTDQAPLVFDTVDHEDIRRPSDTSSILHLRKKRRGNVTCRSNRSVSIHSTDGSNHDLVHRASSHEIHPNKETPQDTGAVSATRARKYSTSSHTGDEGETPLKAMSTSHSVTGETASEGLIIKLGSQKRRKRKSSYTPKQSLNNTKPDMGITKHEGHLSEPSKEAIPDHGIVDDDTDDSVCPVCRKMTAGQMVQCDRCDRWYHCSCVGFIIDAKAAEKAFYCPNCSNPKSSK